jgi:predicted ArsR family transcriptional regulator
MKEYNPPLMTAGEAEHAKRVGDNSLFTAGVPAVVESVVERSWAEPYLLLSQWFGERAETAIEPLFRAIGKAAGFALRPVFSATQRDGEHKLEATLKATRFAENLTGIIGEDFYVNENKVVRRVHTCPFKDREGAKILCHLGEAAGQELFSELVPGTRHKVQVTMARGHGHCEYAYEIN